MKVWTVANSRFYKGSLYSPSEDHNTMGVLPPKEKAAAEILLEKAIQERQLNRTQEVKDPRFHPSALEIPSSGKLAYSYKPTLI